MGIEGGSFWDTCPEEFKSCNFRLIRHFLVGVSVCKYVNRIRKWSVKIQSTRGCFHGIRAAEGMESGFYWGMHIKGHTIAWGIYLPVCNKNGDDFLGKYKSKLWSSCFSIQDLFSSNLVFKVVV